jgi:hypothetical protein
VSLPRRRRAAWVHRGGRLCSLDDLHQSWPRAHASLVLSRHEPRGAVRLRWRHRHGGRRSERRSRHGQPRRGRPRCVLHGGVPRAAERLPLRDDPGRVLLRHPRLRRRGHRPDRRRRPERRHGLTGHGRLRAARHRRGRLLRRQRGLRWHRVVRRLELRRCRRVHDAAHGLPACLRPGLRVQRHDVRQRLSRERRRPERRLSRRVRHEHHVQLQPRLRRCRVVRGRGLRHGRCVSGASESRAPTSSRPSAAATAPRTATTARPPRPVFASPRAASAAPPAAAPRTRSARPPSTARARAATRAAPARSAPTSAPASSAPCAAATARPTATSARPPPAAHASRRRVSARPRRCARRRARRASAARSAAAARTCASPPASSAELPLPRILAQREDSEVWAAGFARAGTQHVRDPRDRRDTRGQAAPPPREARPSPAGLDARPHRGKPVSRPDKPPLRIQTTTLWDYPSQHYGQGMQGDSRYVGATPSYIPWNLIQRYTREGDLVIDPMCGSGTTLDVCKDTRRRGRGFDVKPFRPDIEAADARKLPVESGSARLVFMDPPYGDHIDYSEDPRCIGKLSAYDPRFYQEMRKGLRRVRARAQARRPLRASTSATTSRSRRASPWWASSSSRSSPCAPSPSTS